MGDGVLGQRGGAYLTEGAKGRLYGAAWHGKKRLPITNVPAAVAFKRCERWLDARVPAKRNRKRF